MENTQSSTAVPGPSERWFALGTRARHEKMAATMLENKGYQSFLPLYDSSRSRQLPLFPGYVFCQFNPVMRMPILTTPGVLYVVGLGHLPAAVEDSEMESVRRLIRSSLRPEPWPYLRAGERVQIREGSLQGLTGTLVSVKSSHRLVVSITLLQRSIAVEVDRNWVIPAPMEDSAG